MSQDEVLRVAHERLREAAIAACSEMGCYCVGDHESLPPEQRCALCRLGDLLSSPVNQTERT